MREAHAAALLRSEHAVKVVDVGVRSNGSPSPRTCRSTQLPFLYFTAPNGTSSSTGSARASMRLAPRVGTSDAGMGLEGTW
jgi:hypothetical protein